MSGPVFHSFLHRLAQLSGYVELLAYTSLLLPVLLAAGRWRWLPRSLRLLAAVPAYMALVFGLMRLIGYYGVHNIWLAHLSVIGETLLYLMLYTTVLVSLRRWRPVLLAGFAAFAAFDSFWLEGLARLNTYTIALESFVVTLLALLYLEKQLRTGSAVPLLRRPLAVASIGIVLYLAGTVSVYMASNYYIGSNDGRGLSLLYLSNSLLLLLYAGLLSVAFTLVPARAVSSG